MLLSTEDMALGLSTGMLLYLLKVALGLTIEILLSKEDSSWFEY